MHRFSIAFKEGTLDEIEARQRTIWRADKKVKLAKVTILLLNTSNPVLFGVCHLHEYQKHREKIESLGFSVARRIDIVLHRSLSSVPSS